MQIEHSRVMMNKDNEHRKAFEAKEAEHKEETNILNSIINTAHRWYPDFAHLLRFERLTKQIGLSAMESTELIKGRTVNFTGDYSLRSTTDGLLRIILFYRFCEITTSDLP